MGNETTDIKLADGSDIKPFSFKVDRIKRPNCKLCNSELREIAETMYDEQKRKNYTVIQNTLKNKHDFNISLNAVRNHLIYHYNVVETNEALQEYADDLERWINLQPNKAEALRARIAILQREMFIIAQKGEDLDIVERRKNAETVKKLSEVILAHEDKMDEFLKNMKPVNLIFNQLKIIVTDEIQHIDSVKTKKVLSKVLTRLKDSVGSMIVEE